jgi:triose/dihydroxyacetone kinase / FAD-AMP lyase (cyclizing)
MTSLNAPGFSIHLLNVSNIYRSLTNSRGELNILQLLDDPTDAHAWVGVRRFWPDGGQRRDYASEEKDTAHTLYLSHDEIHLSLDDVVERDFWRTSDISPEGVKTGILRACRAVLEVEKDMTEFDTIVGDGDCGETFAMGAKGK